MTENTLVHQVFTLRTGWFIVVVLNFIFGIVGIIICNLNLSTDSGEELSELLYKISIVFAGCNLVLSVLLLVSVIKSNDKYSFFFAFLNFTSLFSASVYLECSGTGSVNVAFIVIFTAVGVLFLGWFSIFACYQTMALKNKSDMREVEIIYI